VDSHKQRIWFSAHAHQSKTNNQKLTFLFSSFC
jgi:hypothetical protein